MPEGLDEVWRTRDESAELHRAAYTGVSRQVPLPNRRLHDALYDRHMPVTRRPDGLRPVLDLIG